MFFWCHQIDKKNQRNFCKDFYLSFLPFLKETISKISVLGTTNEFILTAFYLLGQKFFRVFLVDLVTAKGHFEIVWPLTNRSTNKYRLFLLVKADDNKVDRSVDKYVDIHIIEFESYKSWSRLANLGRSD